MSIQEAFEDELVRHEKIERYLESLTGTPSQWRHSPYGRVLSAVTRDALNGDDRPALGLINIAIDYMDSLRFALDAVPMTGPDSLAFWSHRADLLAEIKEHRAPAPIRDALERSVGDYLDLPFRSSTIDRTLVDALVATELISYGQLVYADHGPLLRGPYAELPAKRPGRELAISVLVELLVLAALVFGLHWLTEAGFFPAAWLTVSVTSLGVLFVASSLFGIIRYPAFAKRLRLAQEEVLKPLRAMVETYMSLASAGPLSLERVRKSIDEAVADNVAWPASLHALVDDIATRTARL